jgi:hypothetical protein
MNSRFRRGCCSIQRLIHWRYSQLVLLGIGLAWLMPLLNLPAGLAQSVMQAQVTEILDGSQVYIQERQVAVNSVAQRQQRVRTAAARAELRFNTGAVARLAQNSSLTVGDCAQLRRGTLLVNGPLNGCTQSTLAGVRGTIYTLEVDEADQTIIRVLEGEVLISPRPAGSPEEADLDLIQPLSGAGSSPSDRAGAKGQAKQVPGEPQPQTTPTTEASANPAAETVPLTADSPVTVQQGQQITIAPEATEAVVEPISLEVFRALLGGPLLQGFTAELPGAGALQRSFEQIFPGVPFPLSRPAVPIPSIRLPFPF